jgi:hypothetical protein
MNVLTNKESRMSPKRVSLVAVVLCVVVLLAGCHRLGLVKAPAKPISVTASPTASVAATASVPTVDPASISITVENGGGVNGRGAAMVSKLSGLGFRPGKATNAKLKYPTTTVFFTPGHAAAAAQVSKAIAIGKTEAASAVTSFTTDVLVMVGKDF